MFLVWIEMERMGTLAAICTTFDTDHALICYFSTSKYYNDWYNAITSSHMGNILATSAITSQTVTMLIQMYQLANAGLIMMRSNQTRYKLCNHMDMVILGTGIREISMRGTFTKKKHTTL